MVKKKKGPGRPRRRGRPKGSRNKNVKIVEVPIDDDYKAMGFKKGDQIRIYGPEAVFSGKANLTSRLDECMTRLETAVAEAISKLKEMI